MRMDIGDNMIKKISTIFIILLALVAVYAQENLIKISHMGYGSTPQEIKLTVHNIGDNTLHKLMFYLDGELIRERDTVLGPKAGIATSLNLEPGEHLIEVKTSEGAYDSLEITISSITQEDSIPSQDEVLSFTKTNNFRSIIVFGILTLVVIWLLMKKPKLDL